MLGSSEIRSLRNHYIQKEPKERRQIKQCGILGKILEHKMDIVKTKEVYSSHCGLEVTNPISILEDTGSILELPYAMGASPKKRKKKKKDILRS